MSVFSFLLVFIFMKYKITKENLEKVVKESLSIAEVCKKLNIIPAGGNYKTLNFKIANWNIDKNHFTGKVWNVGNRFKKFGKEYTLSEILVEKSLYTNSHKLKLKLFKEGLKDRRCEKCNNTEWLKENIPLELEHVNGNNRDNRIENLCILCPNCHALTPTYRRRKKSTNKF
jgi:hypothetical protein